MPAQDIYIYIYNLYIYIYIIIYIHTDVRGYRQTATSGWVILTKKRQANLSADRKNIQKIYNIHVRSTRRRFSVYRQPGKHGLSQYG